MKLKRHVVPQTAQLLSLLLALLVVLTIGLSSYQASADFNRRNEHFKATQQIAEDANALLSALKDAETGQRGFLLTGREAYLDPYRTAVEGVPVALGHLADAITRERLDQQGRVATLRRLVEDKLAELKRTVDVRNREGAEAALAIVQSDRGKVLMDEIRRISRDIQGTANQQSTLQSEEARAGANRIELIGTLGSAILFALLILATITIQRGTNRRHQLIANLQESEEQTREARDWLETTIGSIGDGVIATDERGRVSFFNPVAQSLTGWKREEALGLPLESVFSISSEETGARVESPVTKALREGTIVGLANHTTLTSKDGRQIPIDDSAAPIRDIRGHVIGVVMVFRDIIERRANELREKKASAALGMLAAIVESSQDAIISTDLNGLVTSWNRAAERVFGFTSDETIGKPLSTFGARDRPETLMAVLERVRTGLSVDQSETVGRTKSGNEIQISMTVSPILDSQGAVTGMSEITRDISDRVAAGKYHLKQAELLARTNDDLQQFAYAASHDLREPLRTISSFSDLLMRRNKGEFDEQNLSYLRFIAAGCTRMKQLVDALSEYARAGEVSDKPVADVHLDTVVQTALASLRAAIDESQAVVTFDHGLPCVSGDEIHFGQVLQNLISNALKYRGAEKPRIHVGGAQKGESWIISVADNGQGIGPEYRTQIFELFRRLHGQEYQGTGIGLALCRKIVHRYGGKIWVESEPGKGSKFCFTVPKTGR
jgi:PAS domain S-box-containing protein